jgi:hypothetical protein
MWLTVVRPTSRTFDKANYLTLAVEHRPRRYSETEWFFQNAQYAPTICRRRDRKIADDEFAAEVLSGASGKLHRDEFPPQRGIKGRITHISEEAIAGLLLGLLNTSLSLAPRQKYYRRSSRIFSHTSVAGYEHPLVAPQVSHLRQVPLRIRVKLPHSAQLSPS